MPKRTRALFCITLLLSVPAAVNAQPKPKLADQVKELSTKVDEALKSAAEGSSAAKALQDLSVKVSGLRQELDKLEQKSQGYEAMRAKLERYESRIGNLELDLAALKMQAAEKAVGAGFNDGFFVQSNDRKFLLRLNGLAQVGYFGRIYSEERLGTGDVVGADQSSFLLRRARIAASGHLMNWRLSYRLEMDFGTADPGPLLEGWGEVHLHKMIRIRAGRQKVPFARQFIIHSAYQEFVDRSGATQSFAHGWDLGAVVLGNIPIAGVISYQLGIFNGAGSGFSRDEAEDENTDFLYVARLLYQPLGPVSYAEGDTQVGKLQVAVGGALSYNLTRTDIAQRKGVTDPIKATALNDADADGNIDNVEVLQLSGELVARLGGLALQSELFYRQEDPGAVDVERSYWGLYTQASFFHFSSALQLAARYGYWEPNSYGEDRSGVHPTRIHELAAALNGLIWKQRIKWQIEYSHRWWFDLKAGEKDLAGEIKVHTIQAQAQIAF